MSSSASSASESSLDARALAKLERTRNFSKESLDLLLHLKELFLLVKGLALGQWRDSRDPVSGAFAEHCQAEILLEQEEKANAIFSGRFGRIPAAHRNRYLPEERFQIVQFVRTYHWTYERAAEKFFVDPQTISRWVKEATSEPDKNTVGSLLKANPPLRTIDDVTRELVVHLDELGAGGNKTIMQMLWRAGTTVGRETVRRIRKGRRDRKPAPPPPPKVEPPVPPVDTATLHAKESNHIWMTDITNVPSFLRIWMFKLVVVLDVYSRFPLAFRVFNKEPASEEIAALVQTAVDRYGTPDHFVTDQGRQFTGSAFVEKLLALGTMQRFGAIGRSGSIAIIERFWRTMKEILRLRLRPPLSIRHLEDRVEMGLNFYATLRPHQGLEGATPAEVYFGFTPLVKLAISRPHRTSPSPRSAADLPYALAHADPSKRMPFLIPQRRVA